MKYSILTLSDLEKSLIEILSKVPPGSAFTLSGHPGAGKTTLVKTASKILGVKENVQSPTFNLLNIYKGTSLDKHPIVIYHYDFYRLTKGAPVFDLVFPSSETGKDFYVFMEWPERVNIQTILPNIDVYALTIDTKYSLEENEVIERILTADI